MRVTVVGAGLAGCEAAWQLACRGIPVTLLEMKPAAFSPAHRYAGFAELVCSNSLKAQRLDSAAGLLKEEMRRLGSVCLMAAQRHRVPAGGALAVERVGFSNEVTRAIKSHPLITVKEQTVEEIPEGTVILATGPLTQGKLAQSIGELVEQQRLAFFDAAAPIVSGESVDTSIAFFASRYGKGDGEDYLNCPMNKEEYEAFYQALVEGERALLSEEDQKQFTVYEGCMPIEVMARRGKDTIRFGPMKPVGLKDPRTGHRPWAVLQLRREDPEGKLYNLVGFQTNLKFPEQKRIFSMIPGLEHAEFYRYGVMHRNTFLDSPHLLEPDFSLRKDPRIFFAGQITGVEGYMESAASGLLAGLHLARRLSQEEPTLPPETTMLGALSRYVSGYPGKDFQPMGSNMGILPSLENPVRDKRLRYQALADRSLQDLARWMEQENIAPAEDKTQE